MGVNLGVGEFNNLAVKRVPSEDAMVAFERLRSAAEEVVGALSEDAYSDLGRNGPYSDLSDPVFDPLKAAVEGLDHRTWNEVSRMCGDHYSKAIQDVGSDALCQDKTAARDRLAVESCAVQAALSGCERELQKQHTPWLLPKH